MTPAEARDRSLQLANEKRLERQGEIADLKRQWRGLPCPVARKRLAVVLRDPSPALKLLEIERVLLACNGMGPVKTDQYLRAAGITTGKLCVGDLGRKCRDRLADALDSDDMPVDVFTELDTLRSQVAILRGELRRLRGTA